MIFAGQQGWHTEDLNETIMQLKLQDCAFWLGQATKNFLGFLYKQCYILAFPSLYEGFGLPLLEAMVHGKPVLTSNLSSMPEVAGPAGFLVDPNSTESIYNGLHTMLANNALYKELSQAAQTQTKNFSWEKTASNMQEVFHHLIQTPNSSTE